jgi:hypothetical protein
MLLFELRLSSASHLLTGFPRGTEGKEKNWKDRKTYRNQELNGNGERETAYVMHEWLPNMRRVRATQGQAHLR